VVLTFDDGCISNTEFVAPLLEEYGFGATFFFTDAFLKDESLKDKNYMTWDDALKIHDAGFEIGNHTQNHPGVKGLSALELKRELEYIENRCKEYGIAIPKTFCYPGFGFDLNAVQVLREKGYLFARRGIFPEYKYNREGARGPAYEPAEDDPLLIPCTGFSGPDWNFEDFLWALEQGGKGKIPVFCFHGVPDLDHPWVNTDAAVFKKYMDYLPDNNYTVIAMRDLIKYVDPEKYPVDPNAPIKRRISSLR
jgi:peptidoglycan/xylan/chitin deacetylase (PgdA/CDA1 family)